jgi:phosphopantetheine adenylyltransferase
MNIGLYFGSYNPIHIGHLIIGSHATNGTDIQQVWLVVSPQNPFKAFFRFLLERIPPPTPCAIGSGRRSAVEGFRC